MQEVIRKFIQELESVPGWGEWQRKKVSYTLNFDDPYPASPSQPVSKEFHFPEDIQKQHAVIIAFLVLTDGVESLKECEYYFRRYPFRGLPVGQYRHIVNICEMYFNRFYEIRGRFKNVLNAINALISPEKIDVGAMLKQFDKIFNQEIRARHGIHHRERFDDAAISRIFLAEALFSNRAQDANPMPDHVVYYRRLANEWVQRVRQKGREMDWVLEAAATAIVKNCNFSLQQKI